MKTDLEKFHGPTFSWMVDVTMLKKQSLIRKVSSCSPDELGALVIGGAVYEVFLDLPECELLKEAMVSLKRKQEKLTLLRALRWINENLSIKQIEETDRIMKYQDMQLFLSRCPIHVLSNAVFKPFLPVVKKFLLHKLFTFTNKGLLYKVLPEFPSEKQLPVIINALGPMEQLSKKYPHLARMKHEMIFNIMDFIVKYCLDWIRELLLLKCDSNGKVEYYCPPAESKKREKLSGKKLKRSTKNRESSALKVDMVRTKANIEDGGWETQTMTNSSSASSSNVEDLKEVPVRKRAKMEVTELKEEGEILEPPVVPSCSSTVQRHPYPHKAENLEITSQEIPQSSLIPQMFQQPQSLPVSSFPIIHDDWSDILTMALTDPSLASHYKTMIHCLVASNRDMKNMIVMMKSQQS